jgi:A/G-specific adenine glycosylase
MDPRTVSIGRSQRSGGPALAEALLGWYRPRRGAYPWRGSRDPYAILVSEVMLQQTQAARVGPAFERFLSTFPSVAALAAASRADVVRAWEGLGYNRRAVALSEAARTIAREHAGRIPSDPARLRSLPGVGPYTASAVASLAYGVPVPAVDTNVRRVVARVHLGQDPHDAPPKVIRTAAEAWLDPEDPGSWNQALMDLGREICRPRPRCDACPLADACLFLATGAIPGPSRRRQGRFEGSTRQVRGAIVHVLRGSPSPTLDQLAARTGFELARVARAVGDLHEEGVLDASRSALEGRGSGRVRLAT